MRRLFLSACVGAAVSSTAFAQQQLSRSFQPITSPVKNAGVYHAATGTWTRPASQAQPSSVLAGGTLDTIYACTASSYYFGAMDPGQTWSAPGRIPSTTSPDSLWNSSALPEGSQMGSARGLADSYQIEMFSVGYCTTASGPTVALTIAFFESWNPACTSSLSSAPPTGGPFALTGLPGGGALSNSCWTVTIDLNATSASFSMQADGDGAYSLSTDDAFGWTFTFPSVTSPPQLGDTTGMMLAGGPSWIPVFAAGSGPCQAPHPGVGWLQGPWWAGAEAAGYDGRRFDIVSGACDFPGSNTKWPANNSSFAYPGAPDPGREAGSDMLGLDRYRIEGGTTEAPGCYFFGGPASSAPPNGPYSNLFLELFAKVAVAPPPPGLAYCAGDGLVSPPTAPCPCGNFGAAGHGCGSSFNAAGANLTASGAVASDDVVLNGSGMQSTGICVFLEGDAIDANGFQFGDGMTCTGGNLIRLRGVALTAGSASFPVAPETVTLSARGGNTVGSGQLASYTVFYRNAAAAYCPPFTFNASNNYQITW